MKGYWILHLVLFLSCQVSIECYYKQKFTLRYLNPCRDRLQFSLALRKKVAKGPVNVHGKGFAKPNIIPTSLYDRFKPTKPGEYRVVDGQYKKLLGKHLDIYSHFLEQQQNSKEIIMEISDIYARSELTFKTFFVGRIIHSKQYRILDAIKSIEILLSEYAKSLQPVEIGKVLSRYPQLFFTKGFTDKFILSTTMNSNQEDQELFQEYNLTRYYHFNKETTLFDFHEIGFEPKVYTSIESTYQQYQNHLQDIPGALQSLTPVIPPYCYASDDGRLIPRSKLTEEMQKQSEKEQALHPNRLDSGAIESLIMKVKSTSDDDLERMITAGGRSDSPDDVDEGQTRKARKMSKGTHDDDNEDEDEVDENELVDEDDDEYEGEEEGDDEIELDDDGLGDDDEEE